MAAGTDSGADAVVVVVVVDVRCETEKGIPRPPDAVSAVWEDALDPDDPAVALVVDDDEKDENDDDDWMRAANAAADAGDLYP